MRPSLELSQNSPTTSGPAAYVSDVGLRSTRSELATERRTGLGGHTSLTDGLAARRTLPALPGGIGVRTRGALTDVEVEGPPGSWCERDDHVLAALADDGERAMSTVHVHRLDVGTKGFADPQPFNASRAMRA